MRTVRRRRVALVVAGVAAIVLLLLGLAQVLLPGVAASRVRGRVQRYGTVRSVQVSASPAIQLLWGKADSVGIVAGTLTASAAQVAALLEETHGVDRLSVDAQGAVLRVPQLPSGLAVSDVRLRKQGGQVSVTATLTQAALDAALPSGFRIEPTASGNGEVEARASGGLFGLQASITAVVRPQEGALIAEPTGIPFGGIAAVTLFSDPHLKVSSVGVRVLSSNPLSYGLSLSARLS